MVSRAAFHAFLLFVLTFLLHGATAKPSFSLAGKRSSLASSRAAALEYSTNATCMAAGLQPYHSTAFSIPQGLLPVLHPLPYSGFLHIYKASNAASLGWVRKDLHTSSRATLTTSTPNRAPASFTYIDANTLIQISITTVTYSFTASGSESFIWKYNTGSGEFTVWWTNPNGSQVDAYIYHYGDSGPNAGLYISANGNLPGGFEQIRLYYTSS
ncbi:hypothetical protein BJ165DRAFT_1608778 [Panaeolus papilionaceus]|nr:hypothetical protein BJ165DRAFT_1608778 [Panaeolus papilionaceus]